MDSATVSIEAAPSAGSRGGRRLVLVIGAVVFLDTLFYAAIAPLLPALAHQLHLSKLSAGVMTASYPIGTLIGSIPGGVLAARVGPKVTVYVGLALLAVSTVAFGVLQNPAALDGARFIEGVGGAFTWAGGLAWLVSDGPAGQRGGLIGGAIGAAIAGSLFGPVIGTAANAIGRAPAFAAVGIVALVLIDQTRRLHSSRVSSDQGLRHVQDALRHPGVIAGMWLVALPAVVSGTINVLGPLRLHHLGASVAWIGATFLASAAVEALVSPAIGRLSDRRGRLLPLRAGLLCVTVVLACFTLPASAAGLAVVIVATQTALGAFWAPAMAMLADAAEHRALDLGLAAALMNLAWASGQIVGAGAGGAVAKAAGDGLPVMIAVALCAVTLLVLVSGPGTRALTES
jgi:MFS family permease